MNWLLIALIIIALVSLVKFTHFKSRLMVIIIVALFLFFYITFGLVAKNHDLNFRTASGLVDAGKVYFSWFGNAFGNLKTITANAINMRWLPENKTISDMNPKNIMKG